MFTKILKRYSETATTSSEFVLSQPQAPYQQKAGSAMLQNFRLQVGSKGTKPGLNQVPTPVAKADTDDAKRGTTMDRENKSIVSEYA